MSGALETFLSDSFCRLAPPGFAASKQADLFDETRAQRLGFHARLDVQLVGPRGLRIGVEFEISRADPVANQVKFLVAQQSGALGPDDVLVSMMSPHIVRGRRNLAGAFSRQLRASGVGAFLVSLLPQLEAREVRRLNHRAARELARLRPIAPPEVRRALAVALPQGERDHRIHFAGDVVDVIANIWTWKDAMDGAGADLWKRRRVQFFVHDPLSKLFAPAKFCAFVPARRPSGPRPPPTMTMEVYASLGERDPRFDGHRARRHLARRLAFVDVPLTGALAAEFENWWHRYRAALSLHTPVRVLLPPPWYGEVVMASERVVSHPR
jgi:hypothetical protein